MMEGKQREQKKARTIRTEYVSGVDELQAWLRVAALKIQDRSINPLELKEFSRQIQSELVSMTDKLEQTTKKGHTIIESTKDDEEKELIRKTIVELNERLSQVKSLLDEKKQQIDDSLDAWQRFLSLYESVKAWTEEKKIFLQEPLKLNTLVHTRQKFHDYSTAVKSCKQVNKNLSEMGKELEMIGQFTSVGDLPGKLAEVEEVKVEVEGQLLERNALLQEACEEWDQCEKKFRDAKNWMEKAQQSLESPQNKKKPLRDQHAIREKMLSDIAIQKTKITISVEKLRVHFRSGIGDDSNIVESANEIITELNTLNETVHEQCITLEACLSQIDQYQQEIQQMRQNIIEIEQQLRTVLSPTYLPENRERAIQEQQTLQRRVDNWRKRANSLLDKIHTVDPNYSLPGELNTFRLSNIVSYADMAAGRSNPNSRGSSPHRYQRGITSDPSLMTVALTPSTDKYSMEHYEYTKQPITKEEPNPMTNFGESDIDLTQKKKEKTISKPHRDSSNSENTSGTSSCRGRSQIKRIKPKKTTELVELPQVQVNIDVTQVNTSSNECLPDIQQSTCCLAPPKDSRRARSSSPIWKPGSVTYAAIVKGNSSRCLPAVVCNESNRNVMVEYSSERETSQSITNEKRRRSLGNDLSNIDFAVTKMDQLITRSENDSNIMMMPFCENTCQVLSMHHNDEQLKNCQITENKYAITVQDSAKIENNNYTPRLIEFQDMINSIPSNTHDCQSHDLQSSQVNIIRHHYDSNIEYTKIYEQSHEEHQLYQSREKSNFDSININELVLETSQHQSNQMLMHNECDRAISFELDNVHIEKDFTGDRVNSNRSEEPIQQSSKVKESSISYAKILSQGLPIHTASSSLDKSEFHKSGNYSQSPNKITPPVPKLVKPLPIPEAAKSEIPKKLVDNQDRFEVVRKKGLHDKIQVNDLSKRSAIKNRKKKIRNEQVTIIKQVEKPVHTECMEASSVSIPLPVIDETNQKQQKVVKSNEKNEKHESNKSGGRSKQKNANKKTKMFEGDEIDIALKEIAHMNKQKNKTHLEKVKKIEEDQNMKRDRSNRRPIEKVNKIQKSVSHDNAIVLDKESGFEKSSEEPTKINDQAEQLSQVSMKSKLKQMRKNKMNTHAHTVNNETNKDQVQKVFHCEETIQLNQRQQELEINSSTNESFDILSASNIPISGSCKSDSKVPISNIESDEFKDDLNQTQNVQSSLGIPVDSRSMETSICVSKKESIFTNRNCTTEKFITLRPANVEASLITTYAAVMNPPYAADNLESSSAISTDSNSTSTHIETRAAALNIDPVDDNSISAHKNIRSSLDKSDSSIEIVTDAIEIPISDSNLKDPILNKDLVLKRLKHDEFKNKISLPTQFILEDLPHLYWMDYHQYRTAEISFHQNYRVVKVIKQKTPFLSSTPLQLLVQVSSRSPSNSCNLEPIVQESAEINVLSLPHVLVGNAANNTFNDTIITESKVSISHKKDTHEQSYNDQLPDMENTKIENDIALRCEHDFNYSSDSIAMKDKLNMKTIGSSTNLESTSVTGKMNSHEDRPDMIGESLIDEIVDLQRKLEQLELSINYLPQEHLETLLSALEVISTRLQECNDRATKLNEELVKIDGDSDIKELTALLTEIHAKITNLLHPVKHNIVILHNKQHIERQSEQDINEYKRFLEETDVWLIDLNETINQQLSTVSLKSIQEELNERIQRIVAFKSPPEVTVLAISLKNALLNTRLRIEEKQQVLNDVYKNIGVCTLLSVHQCTVSGIA